VVTKPLDDPKEIAETAAFLLRRTSTHGYYDALRDMVYMLLTMRGDLWEHIARDEFMIKFVEEHILPDFDLITTSREMAGALCKELFKYARENERARA